MKRILCLVLSAVLLLGMMGITASADDVLKIVVNGGTALPGEEVEVLISLENNPGLTCMSGMIVFDESVLTYAGYTEKTTMGTWSMDTFEDDHVIMWFFDGKTGSYGGSELIALKFMVAENAAPGEYPVAISVDPDWDSIDDADHKPIEAFETVPGSVTVAAPEVIEDGYYLIGTINDWKVANLNESYKFEENPNDDNFMLNAELAVGDEIKVVKVENGDIAAWYPREGGNYVVDEPHSGSVVVYFKPNYDSGWDAFGGYIWINGKLAAAELYGASLSLKGDIGLNFYLVPTDELLSDANSYVTLNGTEYLIKDAKTRTVSGKTLYQFSISLTAKQMGDKVEMKVFSGDGRTAPIYRAVENATSDTYQFSVQDYIQKTIAIDGNGNAKLVKLVKAMSDYGSLAQVQFDYNVADRAEVLADLSSVTAETLARYAVQKPAEAAAGVERVSCSLVLKSETTLRIYIVLAEGEDMSSRTVKVNNSVKTPVETADGWLIEIPNISAKDLDKVYTVVISDAEGAKYTAKACALSYAYSVLSAEGQPASLVDLVKGLYLYNQAANEYFA